MLRVSKLLVVSNNEGPKAPTFQAPAMAPPAREAQTDPPSPRYKAQGPADFGQAQDSQGWGQTREQSRRSGLQGWRRHDQGVQAPGSVDDGF